MAKTVAPRARLARVAPLLAVLIFWALAVCQLSLPGFHYDEALDLPPALELAQGRPPPLQPHDPGLTVGGLTLPLMILEYLGAANTYLLVPVFAAAGASWWVVRMFEVAVGALVVALAYRLARLWFDPATGALTALLLAAGPSFVFWTRVGISVTSIMAVCSLGSLALMAEWRRRGGRGWRLGAAGWLLGAGLWAKFLFLWWLTALAAAYLGLYWRRWWPPFKHGAVLGFSPRAWAWGLGGLALGAAPLIYYNALTGNSIRVILDAIQTPTRYGVDNRLLIGNLRAAVEHFRVFLDGSYFWYHGEILSNPWAVRLYLTALLVAGILCWTWSPARRRKLFVALILIGLVVAQSAFTLSGIWATHLYILVPLPQMVVAAAAVGLWRAGAQARQRPLRFALPAGALLLAAGLFGGEVMATARYHASLAKFGGVGHYSDAIYALADRLDRDGIHAPAVLDWGAERNVLILTDGRVRPYEIFGYSAEPDPGFRERVEMALCDGCAFVDVDPRYAVFPRAAAFRQIAAEAGYDIVVDAEGIFRERSGQPVYWLYRARWTGPPLAAPP